MEFWTIVKWILGLLAIGAVTTLIVVIARGATSIFKAFVPNKPKKKKRKICPQCGKYEIMGGGYIGPLCECGSDEDEGEPGAWSGGFAYNH